MITFENIAQLQQSHLEEGDLVRVLGEVTQGDAITIIGRVRSAGYVTVNRTIDIQDGLKVEVFPSGGGGGGTVDSVNGQTGVVVLDAADVGALTEATANNKYSQVKYGWGSNQAFTVTDADASPLTWNSGNMGLIRFISSTANKPMGKSGVGILTRYQSSDSASFFNLQYVSTDGSMFTRAYTPSGGWGSWNKIYSERDKPTPSEVGITSGTADPTGGSDGDIYLQYGA